MRVAVLVLGGVFDTGLGATLDTFALANEHAARSTRFDVSMVGVRRRVSTGQGLRVPVAKLPSTAPEVVVVPALSAKTPEGLDAALDRSDVQEAAALLRSWRAEGALVAAACTATFVVASAGLLDGRRATTSWWLASAFRERFAAVKLEEEQMLVRAPGVVTAGAALAHLDLAMDVLRRRSPGLARTASRYLTFDRRPSQGAYSIPDHVDHSDPLVERFEVWARSNLGAFSLDAAARAVGASGRTLGRRVQRVLGKSPLSFVQDLRVEYARHQLETTDRSIDEIATRVGYRDGATLRALLRERTGRGLRELRGRHD